MSADLPIVFDHRELKIYQEKKSSIFAPAPNSQAWQILNLDGGSISAGSGGQEQLSRGHTGKPLTGWETAVPGVPAKGVGRWGVVRFIRAFSAALWTHDCRRHSQDTASKHVRKNSEFCSQAVFRTPGLLCRFIVPAFKTVLATPITFISELIMAENHHYKTATDNSVRLCARRSASHSTYTVSNSIR